MFKAVKHEPNSFTTMNKQTIQNYKTKQQEILATLDQMHSSSNWTAEMMKLEDKLNARWNFLQNRIIEIEEMISDYDPYGYINAQY